MNRDSVPVRHDDVPRRRNSNTIADASGEALVTSRHASIRKSTPSLARPRAHRILCIVAVPRSFCGRTGWSQKTVESTWSCPVDDWGAATGRPEESYCNLLHVFCILGLLSLHLDGLEWTPSQNREINFHHESSFWGPSRLWKLGVRNVPSRCFQMAACFIPFPTS